MPTEPAFPKIGEVFESRYLIEKVVGTGGFSRVYMATQLGVDRPVAIKVLNPQFGTERLSEDERQHRRQLVAKRFEREAKLVSRLRDSHTVIMHDYGRTNANLLFMVLEFVEGVTLGELIRQEGALSPARVVKILRQVLSSLEEAHAMNILHRDIKPANIMVYEHIGRLDQVKVLDFGIAKGLEEDGGAANKLTSDGTLLGTPRYMSPEQIRGDKLSTHTDLYSLGLVGIGMLTGTKAVQGHDSMTIISRHLDSNPIRMNDYDGPEALRQIIHKMTAKDVSERYQTCGEVLEDLEFWTAAGPHLGEASSPHLGEASSPFLARETLPHLGEESSPFLARETLPHLGEESSPFLGEESSAFLGEASSACLGGEASSPHLVEDSSHLAKTLHMSVGLAESSSSVMSEPLREAPSPGLSTAAIAGILVLVSVLALMLGYWLFVKKEVEVAPPAVQVAEPGVKEPQEVSEKTAAMEARPALVTAEPEVEESPEVVEPTPSVEEAQKVVESKPKRRRRERTPEKTKKPVVEKTEPTQDEESTKKLKILALPE